VDKVLNAAVTLRDQVVDVIRAERQKSAKNETSSVKSYRSLLGDRLPP